MGKASGLGTQVGIFWHLGRGLSAGRRMGGQLKNALDFAVGILVVLRAEET